MSNSRTSGPPVFNILPGATINVYIIFNGNPQIQGIGVSTKPKPKPAPKPISKPGKPQAKRIAPAPTPKSAPSSVRTKASGSRDSTASKAKALTAAPRSAGSAVLVKKSRK